VDPQADPPRALRSLPSWLLNAAAREATRVVTDALAADGLRRHHYTVMLTLAEGGPASQAQIGRRLAMDRKDMAGVVATLEDAGYVARETPSSDSRVKVVRITPAGKRTLGRLTRRIRAAQDELLAPLDDAERAELQRLLSKLDTARRAGSAP
jgi:MarR family transcriptional regulator, lower aerobic nicotinate degradation pathway regulator